MGILVKNQNFYQKVGNQNFGLKETIWPKQKMKFCQTSKFWPNILPYKIEILAKK